MYACPMEPFQPPTKKLGNPPRFRTQADVDAWIEVNRRPAHWAMLTHVPAFESMAELDAWMESCKDPDRWNRHDGYYTEAEWQEQRRQGNVRGSGGPRPS